jgi:hypothetical protein
VYVCVYHGKIYYSVAMVHDKPRITIIIVVFARQIDRDLTHSRVFRVFLLFSVVFTLYMYVCVHVSPRRRFRSNDVVCTHFRQSRATFCGRLIDHKFPTKPHGY